ncbi:beta-lactamase/transpeptidase-like protein [Dactylonectria estremocensis]|uniref:Beta-lactamase/transpeptidase-like protein n=1 Tax=Dactylonectria estremocensis TaxID=1079267 RepID=A0A9P9I9N8_9HYPO|nr:beta-lactamase/transpeptidase-like protein [Dactylonectria estremocensis]
MKMKHSLVFLFGVVGLRMPTTSAADTAAVRYIDPSQIGTFNMSSLDSTDPPNTAFVTRHEDELLPNRTTQVRHGLKLRRITEGKELRFSTKANGSLHTIDSFMYHFGLAGVMIVKDGAIRLERYQYGNEPSFRNQVQSVTKSFVSTALAIAIKRKKIRLSDRVSKHVPELARSAYGSVPLQNLVDMTSGVTEQNSTNNPDLFNDVYPRTNPEAVLNWFKTFEKVARPGEVYNYYNPNYYVLSLSLTRAIGEPLEDWITKHIWEPAGMKYDGYMRTTGARQVDGHGGLALTLQDMARFGLFVLDSFNGRGGPRVPAGWFDDISAASTSTGIRAPGHIDAVPNSGYQTGWWTMPRGGKRYQLGDDGGFAALGTYGQAIYIIPGINTTIVMQSSYPIHFPDLFYYGQQFATAASLALKK